MIRTSSATSRLDGPASLLRNSIEKPLALDSPRWSQLDAAHAPKWIRRVQTCDATAGAELHAAVVNRPEAARLALPHLLTTLQAATDRDAAWLVPLAGDIALRAAVPPEDHGFRDTCGEAEALARRALSDLHLEPDERDDVIRAIPALRRCLRAAEALRSFARDQAGLECPACDTYLGLSTQPHAGSAAWCLRDACLDRSNPVQFDRPPSMGSWTDTGLLPLLAELAEQAHRHVLADMMRKLDGAMAICPACRETFALWPRLLEG